MGNFMLKVLSVVLLTFSSVTFAGSDTISGEYSGNNRYAQFEQLKNGDVKFYISGIGIGSQYPCNLGEGNLSDGDPAQKLKLSVLKMNGSTGGFTDADNSISVEFGKLSITKKMVKIE